MWLWFTGELPAISNCMCVNIILMDGTLSSVEAVKEPNAILMSRFIERLSSPDRDETPRAIYRDTDRRQTHRTD